MMNEHLIIYIVYLISETMMCVCLIIHIYIFNFFIVIDVNMLEKL